jgi:Protein of unknown function (DUF3303)
MLFMVIEHFKNRDALSVYRRFRDRGRMAPEGLRYSGRWVETNFDRCFQLMECDAKGPTRSTVRGAWGENDASLLEKWAEHWRDLIEFEFIPVRPSKEVAEIMAPQL